MPKPKGPRPKHVPQRTCVICRNERGKRELIRIVHVAGEGVRVDPSGKMAGRGAYLCNSRACWQNPGFVPRLSAALKTRLSETEIAALLAYATTVPEDDQPSAG